MDLKHLKQARTFATWDRMSRPASVEIVFLDYPRKKDEGEHRTSLVGVGEDLR